MLDGNGLDCREGAFDDQFASYASDVLGTGPGAEGGHDVQPEMRRAARARSTPLPRRRAAGRCPRRAAPRSGRP